MEDNIQGTDTSQKEPITLEEAIFGESSENSIKDAFTGMEAKENAAPQEGQPVQSKEEVPQLDNAVDNDKVRYQYWQSEADKYKNELDKYKGMEQKMNQMMQTQQQQVQQQAQPPQETEQFPPAPEKPEKPRNFNREDAYADPSSESARYLDSVEDWRDNIDEYNSLKNEYNSAIVQERLDLYEQNRVEEIQRNQAYQKKQQQTRGIYSHVTDKYGMNDSEAKDFMSKMSDPSSISMDNLVQLYRMQQGAPANANSQVPPKSKEFQQSQNAQQVPSTMGVMPSGQSNTDTRTPEDKIMDAMIGDFDKKNPWK